MGGYRADRELVGAEPEQTDKPGLAALFVGVAVILAILLAVAWIGGALAHVLLRLAVGGWGAGG